LAAICVVLAPTAVAAREQGVSLTELLARHERNYDEASVILHAELRAFPPDGGTLLIDDRCGLDCPEAAIRFAVPASLEGTQGIRSLRNARLDNEHRCFVKLRVSVIYKPVRASEPPPPNALRVARLNVLNVVKLSNHPFNRGHGVTGCS
jgi:hypothetical protein